jgi:hypothetical protein
LEIEDQRKARLKLINLIKREEAKKDATSTNWGKENVKQISRVNTDLKVKRQCNFVQFQPVNKDIIEDLVDNFINTVSSCEFKQCALLFWKANEAKYKAIAPIARKYLSVPASSAAVERSFSISGHILSTNRTKMSV